MKLWISLSLFLLFLAKTEKLHGLPTPKIVNLVSEESKQSFDLDFGLFKIKGVQASPNFESVRLPAAVSKNQKSRPEIDFVGERLEGEILKALKNQSVNAKEYLNKLPNIFLASLEPTPNKKSARMANAEVWLDQELAIRLSLMESKFSADPQHWWIAYPAVYNQRTKKWDEIFVVKNKNLKKKILEAIRQAYIHRYGD